MQLDLLVPMRLTRRIAPALSKRQAGGLIINISSVAGIEALPGIGGYNAAKFGLTGWSKSIQQVTTLLSCPDHVRFFIAIVRALYCCLHSPLAELSGQISCFCHGRYLFELRLDCLWNCLLCTMVRPACYWLCTLHSRAVVALPPLHWKLALVFFFLPLPQNVRSTADSSWVRGVQELKEHNVRVITIYPGYVASEMTACAPYALTLAFPHSPCPS